MIYRYKKLPLPDWAFYIKHQISQLLIKVPQFSLEKILKHISYVYA